MPIEYQIGDYGATVILKRVQHEEGVIAVLYRNIPAEAKAALEYLAAMATDLQAQLDAEVAAHNETRHILANLATMVLDTVTQALQPLQEVRGKG